MTVCVVGGAAGHVSRTAGAVSVCGPGCVCV